MPLGVVTPPAGQPHTPRPSSSNGIVFFLVLSLLAAYLHRFAAATGADVALNCTSSSDPCQQQWLGITCTGNGRVREINLNGRGLRGWVPGAEGNNGIFRYCSSPSWCSSTSTAMPSPASRRVLRQHEEAGICLHQSSFFFKSSSPLYNLDLANNSLMGPVPNGFHSANIATLNFTNNYFSGEINFVTHLPSVASIRLNGNQFTGPLPDFSDLIVLQELDVAHNRLTGVVPALLPKILTSGSISLAGNLLQGPVPQFESEVRDDVAEAAKAGCFCRLDSGPCDPVVDSLLLVAGALHSPLILATSWRRNDPCAGWLGVHCSVDKGHRKVTGINLSRLALNGTIDPALASIPSLKSIVLSGNNITGTIPPAIAKLPSLLILDVSDNALAGKIPRFHRGVEVWAEGNRGLYSVAPPIIKASTSFTLVVAILVFAF
ncbi:hypothetical protein QOZ80_3BG0265570 [Eleusine coracana subsp. coracana]|nr:hypothetical protein QOZ80_3BG0265570 [Eleusine coracana subsp. coracana]